MYIITFIIIFLSFDSFAQTTGELINRITAHPGYEVEVVTNSLLKVKNKLSGKVVYRDLSINELPTDFTADLTIDLRTIDTTKYSTIYTLWSEIPVFYGMGRPVIIADINEDQRDEIYGAYKQYNTEYLAVIYEMNPDGSYDSVYKYPDSLGWINNITDLEKDGIWEIANRLYSNSLGWHLIILTKDSIIGYPISIKLKYYYPNPVNGQPTRINFYDLDGDGYPEMIYYFDGTGDSLIIDNSNHVAKYDRENNMLNLIYQNRPPTLTPVRGFSFGDFDLDGRANFSVGSGWGEVFVYEYVGGNDFNLLRIDSLPINHAFLSTFTNDIDGNGKPELWIGGTGFIDGVGSVIIYVYEADADDEYSVVYTIALIGGTTFWAENMFSVDLDNDGVDEIILCINQNVLAFKNTGSEYKLYFIKKNELMNHNSVYYSATAADFDSDGYPEILISMDLVENNSLKGFSRIYKKSTTINTVGETNTNTKEYSLSYAYPNPFNPSTVISYFLSERSFVTIKVYDLLGREVARLISEEQEAGNHSVTFTADKLSSGVYLYEIAAGKYRESKKMLLTK